MNCVVVLMVRVVFRSVNDAVESIFKITIHWWNISVFYLVH